MEPLPEVQDVARQLAALSLETVDLLEALGRVTDIALRLLPSCVGVSITVLVDGDPFTVTATSEAMATVDASQYLLDGPCVEGARSGEPVLVGDVLDEGRWQAFAQTAAAQGIRSSLSIPFRSPDGTLPGCLNLYAGEPGAFSGQAEVVAGMFGARLEDLVTNADLSFMTRHFASELPQRLLDQGKVSEAVEILVLNLGMSSLEARERLEYAASRAGDHSRPSRRHGRHPRHLRPPVGRDQHPVSGRHPEVQRAA